MTYRTDGHVFSGIRPALLLAATLAVLSGAGCTSAALEDGVPPAVARSGGDGPLDTGTYPNLNIPPKAAATPLTPEEREAKLAALRAAQHRQSPPGGGGTPSDANKSRLKLISDDHEADTLKVIEDN